MVKVLPIKTVDYKKAFIKAITTKGFYKNTRRSQDVLKIVNYLKSKGIDDEKVIYNLISEDIFLEKYRDNSNNTKFSEGEFIEAELNREFKKKQDELSNTIKELELTKNDSDVVKEINQSLNAKKNELDSDLTQYKSALDKVSIRVKKLEKKDVVDKKQVNINFEAADQRLKYDKVIDKNTELSSSLKREIEKQIEEYKNKELKRWQNRIWWNLLWVVPLLIFGLLLVIPNEFFHISKVDSEGNEDNRLGIVLGVITFLLNLFFFNLINVRFFSEREKKAKFSNISIPDDLKKKLDDLSNK